MKTAYLKGLEAAVANNRQLKRAVGTYCVLKSFDKSGYVPNTRYQEAADQIGITVRTLYARIKLMQAAGLCRSNSRNGIFLTSWQNCANLFEIPEVKFYYIKGNTRPDLVLDALFIRSRQQVCEKAFLRKVNKNPELKNHLQQVTGLQTFEKGFAAAVYKSQLIATLINQKGQLIELNADTTPGYKNLSFYLGYNSRGGLAYKKRLLVKQGLLTVEKRQFTTAPKVYSAILGTVFYDRSQQQRKLQLTDNFSF